MPVWGRCAAAVGVVVAVLGCGGGCLVLGGATPVAGPKHAPPVPERNIIPVTHLIPATNAVVESDSGRVLRSGDRLMVTIHAAPAPFSSPQVVDEGGRINLHLIGTVLVAGKSCARAQQEIERAYIDQKYYRNVTVIIVPPESDYSVSGEVIRPGPYPLTRNLTLSAALAKGGRYTEFADQTRVILIRGNDRIEIKLDDIRKGKEKDIVIIPGDVIEVPRTWY